MSRIELFLQKLTAAGCATGQSRQRAPRGGAVPSAGTALPQRGEPLLCNQLLQCVDNLLQAAAAVEKMPLCVQQAAA